VKPNKASIQVGRMAGSVSFSSQHF